MNKLKIIITCITLLPWLGFSQNEVTSESDIKEVTVFLSGAEIHRTAKVNLKSGSNVITFEQLSPYINPNSIQVKAKNSGVTIVSVNHQANYLKDNSSDAKLKAINDSIEDLTLKRDIRLGHEKVYQEEKSLLITNKSMKGDNMNVDPEDLMDMADFFRSRLLELETKLLDIKLQLNEINDDLYRLQNQKSTLTQGKVKNTKEIIVNVSSKTSASATFEISYVMTQASWVPKYDIRSEDIAEPVNLTYKADVYNYSGYDWKNVNITLSTGNPSIDNTQPTLTNWYLKYYQNYQEKKGKYKSSYGGGAKPMARTAAPPPPAMESDDAVFSTVNEEPNTIADFTEMVESTVNTEFQISVPYTINSDGKPYLVEIQETELPVEYAYMAIPKQDQDAFLLGRVTGWGKYNLLPGDANVYFEGTFVGTSYLYTNSTNDTLDISLGRDKGIVIKRNKVDELCKNQKIGGNHKTSRGYEIEVRNNKSKEIDIKIQDQIPLSSYKEIEVSLEEQGGAEYNEQTGELTWLLKVAPGETKTLKFAFEVKYPKDYNISNL
ncbi:DUF4139 domain-containing protein [Parvicella tangerina]|uniref:Mucoidy inhibitor MuiA family protein n=1 Tax=Parvicella tangerina TaxID=2829795 RepID=A0A916JNK2_9FLAO|nr:DUF4139 domain-containing protein [Parvicella tangerina]CAG5083966.1 hypothetical protein CRYO30217_02341 [Parvicella tangerina]